MSRIILIGPGRAGLSVATAFRQAGHDIGGVLARRPEAARAAGELLGAPGLGWETPLPAADLLLIAVRDDAIGEVADRLVPLSAGARAAVHLSGLTSVTALAPLAAAGLETGAFHPLQTLPEPEAGAARLRGAWVAVTTDDPALRVELHALAASIATRPFDLADEARPTYHAAASAAANYVVACLRMAHELFTAAGVPFDAARPLVEAVVANVFSLGTGRALTGPIARGDAGTVAAQLEAVRRHLPEAAADYAAVGRMVARYAGRLEQLGDVLA